MDADMRTGSCAHSPNWIDDIPVLGPEDIAIDHEAGVAYVSSQDRLGSEWLIPGVLRQRTVDWTKRGRVYKVDLRNGLATEEMTVRIASGGDFHRVGIDLYIGPSGNRRLFVVNHRAAQSPTNADLEREVDTGRSSDFRGPQGYRARPLNGLWAAPPYLHNGSVPSLYELLLPPGQRTRTFYVGSWEFDPHSVGLQMGSPFPGAFLFDTRLPGNSNAGHNYGTDLNEREKAALIEYIKTL